MKKTFLIVIALALVFTLALTLAACGGSTEQTPQGGTPSTPDSGGQSPETPDGGEQTPETPDEGETPVPPVTYTVTFETNGGSAVKAVTVDEGTAITATPETTLEGYEFGGWYSSSDLSDDSLVTFPYTPADNITLYAKWSKILTAADLYNEVFGEDYAFVSFEEALPSVSQEVLVGTYLSSYEIIAIQIDEIDFAFYIDAQLSVHRQTFGVFAYRGNELSKWKQYYDFSQELAGVSLFENSIKAIPENVIPNSAEYDTAVTILAQIKAQTDTYIDLLNSVKASDFRSTTPITNTTTEIEFADFAAKFMPAGVTPIACYVGALMGRNMESSQNPYFNTGYYEPFDACFVYIDTEGFLNIVEVRIVVPWYTNSTDESLYASALKEEGTNYKIISSSTTTIENPIWTGYTVGVTK